jgi:hypothetical protein
VKGSRKSQFPPLSDSEIRAELRRRADAEECETADPKNFLRQYPWAGNAITGEGPHPDDWRHKWPYSQGYSAPEVSPIIPQLGETFPYEKSEFVEKPPLYPVRSVGPDATSDSDIERELGRIRRVEIAEELNLWALEQKRWPGLFAIRRRFLASMHADIRRETSTLAHFRMSAALNRYAIESARSAGLDTATLKDGLQISVWSPDNLARHVDLLSGGMAGVDAFQDWMNGREPETIESLLGRNTAEREESDEWIAEANAIRDSKPKALKRLGYNKDAQTGSLVSYDFSPFEAPWAIRRHYRAAWRELGERPLIVVALANFRLSDRQILVGDIVSLDSGKFETAFALIKAKRAMPLPPAAPRF